MARKTLDMTGFKVNKLTVVSQAEYYVGPSGARAARWNCICDCGKEVVKRATELRNGTAKSCGCARSSSNKGRGLVEMVGKKYGRWTVVAEDHIDETRRRWLLCVCECGTEKSVVGSSLRNGDSKSCGCLKTDVLRKTRDLVGERFGRWLVVGEDARRGRNLASWICRCDCGTERSVYENSLVRGMSTSCGCYRVERLIESQMSMRLDITGDRYGMWTVLEPRGLVVYPGGGRNFSWLCRCDCGTERVLPMPVLRGGTSQSCGCQTESWMERHTRQYLNDRGLSYVPQKSFSDLRGERGRPLTFDFEVEKTDGSKVLIECQGEQHYRAVEWFGGEEKFASQQRNDQAKRDYAAKLGIELVEIHFSTNTYEKIEKALDEVF